MGNGICERFNRTLIDMLGTLESEKKANWTSHIGILVHATIVHVMIQQGNHHFISCLAVNLGYRLILRLD